MTPRPSWISVRADRGAPRAEGRIDEAVWARFAARLDYVAADATKPDGFAELARALKGDARDGVLPRHLAQPVRADLRGAGGCGAGHARQPHRAGKADRPRPGDLARAINDAVGAVFDEDRIFRIDHYLGKETVQNLIALRFANTLFEPLWNNLAIDHVQITVAETDRGRATAGPTTTSTARCATWCRTTCCSCSAWWPWSRRPTCEPDSVRNEKVKVLRSLRPHHRRASVQSAPCAASTRAGVVDGERGARLRRREAAARPASTETFVALRADIDNWRWAGVPFYLRTGKRLPERRTQIVIQFKPVPHSIFGAPPRRPAGQPAGHRPAAGGGHRAAADEQDAGPRRGGMRLQPLPLNLSLLDAYERPGARRRIAYERLLLDVLARQPDPVRAPRRGGGGLGLDRRRRRQLGPARAWRPSPTPPAAGGRRAPSR